MGDDKSETSQGGFVAGTAEGEENKDTEIQKEMKDGGAPQAPPGSGGDQTPDKRVS
jgi:hypothetical protein